MKDYSKLPERAKTEQEKKILTLADEILRFSQTVLLVNLRFLAMSLGMIKLHPIEESTFMTDGEYLIYNPKYIIKSYREDKTLPTRNYLHSVFHCIFKHMFVGPNIDRQMWNLACNIAVENAINSLKLGYADSESEKQKCYTEKILEKTNILTAEKIYSLLKNGAFSTMEITEMESVFSPDDHCAWYMSENEKKQKFLLPTADSSSERAELDAQWQRISESTLVDMEAFGKFPGDAPGDFIGNITEVTRERYDYSSFLKKFATVGEVTKINNDEFDYIFYEYGLSLNVNSPIIEPLEYKEEKRIREFVIAIDSSGSTLSDSLVQKFIRKTYNILKTCESFFSKVNIHIIQCDSVIQEHIKITNQQEFDDYIGNMKVKGGGGTNFIPVFKKVNELIKEKEFVNLKGLIYFTDGFGTFPESVPPYDTAFVFVDNEYNNYRVPAWAYKIVLTSDEIRFGMSD